jgi:hypothetical protein
MIKIWNIIVYITPQWLKGHEVSLSVDSVHVESHSLSQLR